MNLSHLIIITSSICIPVAWIYHDRGLTTALENRQKMHPREYIFIKVRPKYFAVRNLNLTTAHKCRLNLTLYINIVMIRFSLFCPMKSHVTTNAHTLIFLLYLFNWLVISPVDAQLKCRRRFDWLVQPGICGYYTCASVWYCSEV